MTKTIFTMPKGIAEFDELADGEKMPFSGTLRREGPDKACLVTVDGKTVPGYSDTEEDEEEYEEEEMVEEEGDFMTAMDETI